MEEKKRIVWADLLRLIAILMVIGIHCSDPFNVSPEARSNPEYNLWGSIYGALLRPCVPLFVMLTGMLLLPVREPAGVFYRKRLLRVAVPFLVWSLLYNLFPWFTGVLGLPDTVLTEMFAYAGDTPSQSFGSALRNIAMIPFNFNAYTVPLWYIYMLIGLYLFMPFLSAWLGQATPKQTVTYLALWAVTLFLPYCHEFIAGQTGGTCAWNDFGTLYYFSGFAGYLLLGHCMKNGPSMSTGRTLLVSLVMFAAGYAVTYFGFRHMTAQPGITERQMELFFLYCSPNVLLMTAAVFMAVSKIRIDSPQLKAILANITKCGLGIYMVHYFVVGIGYMVVDGMGVPVCLRIPVTTLFVFAVSWGFVALFHKATPKAAKWIMG